jgi:hypothetical protein
MTPARKAYLLSLTQYPSMTANESAIARAWLARHADEWDDCEFNVRLGSSLELGPDYSDATRAQAAIVTQKRADLVATRGDAALIIEVKIRVALAALGQLIGYQVLWRVEHPETRTIELEAIGHDALLDVVEILQAHGVAVELFPNVALAQLPYG